MPRLWSAVPAAGSMTLRRPSGAAALGLHVSPVGDPAADFGGRHVAALVLVVDPAQRPRINASRVAAALLAESRSVREIAAVTG